MNQSKKITGIILAGGESRRFGSQKAFAKLHHKYFYEYAIEALEKNVDQLYIVSHPHLKEAFQNQTSAQIVQDLPEYQGNGPLAGIYTVMQKAVSDWYMVLPCDSPFVTDSLVKQLISYTNLQGIDAIVPVTNERIQPLIAVYHVSVGTKIEKLLKTSNFKMKNLLDVCNVKFLISEELQLKGLEFENINNQTEYEKAKQKPFG